MFVFHTHESYSLSFCQQAVLHEHIMFMDVPQADLNLGSYARIHIKNSESGQLIQTGH